MITHEEALELVKILYFNINEKTTKELNRTSKIYNKLDNYIAQQEQLSKDVARYFELRDMPYLELHEIEEFHDLEDKLSKVGKAE